MQVWSRLGRLWIAFGLLAASAAGGAVIYKWTDANGVVHYSDQAVPGAERLVTAPAPSNGIGGPTRASAPSAATKTQPSEPGLTAVIASPAKEQVFYGDDVIPVRLNLEPALKPADSITWHLNGAVLSDQPSDALFFTLQALPRGTYVVAATITNRETGESQTTDNVTFYVRQPSELAPQHRRP